MLRNRYHLSLLFFLVGLIALPFASASATPRIRDSANLFTQDTIQHDEKVLDEIYAKTVPHKEVVIETCPSLTDGEGEASAYAEKRFRDERVDGILLLVIKSPHKLVV